jgi:hypothetical protein
MMEVWCLSSVWILEEQTFGTDCGCLLRLLWCSSCLAAVDSTAVGIDIHLLAVGRQEVAWLAGCE